MQPTFLFDDRKRFDAECDHDQLRSSLQPDIPIPTTADPWKKPPVDFTAKNFHPKRKKNRQPPSSSSSPINQFSPREKLLPHSQAANPAVMRPFAPTYQNITTSKSLGDRNDDNEDDSDFTVNTKLKYERVKRMLNTEPYKNPQLHDFRQVIFNISNDYPSSFI
jgi:hypothetical protein